MGTSLKKGDVVTIFLDPSSIAVVPEMCKFNEMTTTISKVVKPKRLQFGTNFEPTYELKGCVSEMGVPFTFMKDMLAEGEA